MCWNVFVSCRFWNQTCYKRVGSVKYQNTSKFKKQNKKQSGILSILTHSSEQKSYIKYDHHCPDNEPPTSGNYDGTADWLMLMWLYWVGGHIKVGGAC